jgi:hypothetical protein
MLCIMLSFVMLDVIKVNVVMVNVVMVNVFMVNVVMVNVVMPVYALAIDITFGIGSGVRNYIRISQCLDYKKLLLIGITSF